ncbi:uncharacterized protein LOC135690857 [Rhopilema esculentum]|uniref:uncharacterized protein LOC135690857 n=1 Tax=Rhopilema esculentum TaxID=499914 RepID=UPI0031DFC949
MEHSEESRRTNNNVSTLQMFSVQTVLPEYSSQDRNINLELPDYCDDEPPPPYSERIKVQTELPVTRPPRYNLPSRSPLETSLHPANDKPFVFNKDFATSKFAVLKLAEFIICLIGLISTAYLQRLEAGKQKKDVVGFFMVFMVASFVFTVIVFWFHFISILKYTGPRAMNKYVAFTCFILGISLLATSALLADINRKKICTFIRFSKKECHLHRFSMMCGFLAMILFFVDSVVYMITSKGG